MPTIAARLKTNGCNMLNSTPVQQQWQCVGTSRFNHTRPGDNRMPLLALRRTLVFSLQISLEPLRSAGTTYYIHYTALLLHNTATLKASASVTNGSPPPPPPSSSPSSSSLLLPWHLANCNSEERKQLWPNMKVADRYTYGHLLQPLEPIIFSVTLPLSPTQIAVCNALL